MKPSSDALQKYRSGLSGCRREVTALATKHYRQHQIDIRGGNCSLRKGYAREQNSAAAATLRRNFNHIPGIIAFPSGWFLTTSFGRTASSLCPICCLIAAIGLSYINRANPLPDYYVCARYGLIPNSPK